MAREKTLLYNGSTGVVLRRQYKELGIPEGTITDTLNDTYPNVVRAMYNGYVKAGADLILTNTFRSHRTGLAGTPYEGRVTELNEKGVSLLREAVSGTDVQVVGDIGPLGVVYDANQIRPLDALSVFGEQVEALIGNKACRPDLLHIETFDSINEAEQALKAIKEVDKKILPKTILTMNFNRTSKGDFRTLSGDSPGDVRELAHQYGLFAYGANCGDPETVGLKNAGRLARELRGGCYGDNVVMKLNAGKPDINGNYKATNRDMKRYALRALEGGANIIGGCCGTTPKHIAAMKAALRG